MVSKGCPMMVPKMFEIELAAISMAMKRIEIPSLSFSSSFVLLPALRTRFTAVIWSEFVCIVFDFKVKRELLT